MKKKWMITGLIALLLGAIGYTGTRFAGEVLFWGGESDITKINENLEKLDQQLTSHDQKITDLNSQLAIKNQDLQNIQTKAQEYQTKITDLETKKANWLLNMQIYKTN